MFDSRDDTPVVGYKQDVGDGAPENVSLTKIKAFVSYVGDSSQCAPEKDLSVTYDRYRGR